MKLRKNHLLKISVILLIAFALAFTQTAYAQQGTTVRGIVTEQSGSPMVGVSVVVKGTTTGVVSLVDGTFSINVPNNESVLTFSFLGYVPREIVVGNQRDLRVVMTENIQEIDEVVVVGYGTQRRSELTGSIVSVKQEEVKDMPAKSLTEAITGRVAGVMVAQGDGTPGSEASILIRGAASINSLSPLYVVDGVRMGTNFSFNIRDVESIEILKDAGSSAIYGAQAAGGVILITTKRGSEGKTKVAANVRYGMKNTYTDIQMLGRDEYIRAKSYTGVDILGLHGVSSASDLPDVDWMDQVYRTGKETEVNISMSGGNADRKYFVSAGYYREDGIYIDNWAERFSFRTNYDWTFGKRFSFGESFYANKRKSNPYASYVGSRGIPFRTSPTAEIYDPDNLGGWGKMPSYIGGPNIVGNEYIYHYANDDYRLEAVLFGNLMIIPGLDLRVTLGGSFRGFNNRGFTEAYDFGTLKGTNATMTSNAGTRQNLTINATLTYEKKFGNHLVKVMGGYEALKNDGYDMSTTATGFPVPVAEVFKLSSNVNKTGSDDLYASRTLSLFGRLNYSYMGKYLLTSNIRRDGSDRFGAYNKWGTFPSVNVAWRLNEESFIKDNVEWLSNAKLRASWGVIGNDGIDQFLYEKSYAGYNVHNYGGTGLVQGWTNQRFPNESIKWEEVNQTDIGIDLSFLRNRLSFTYDWYNRQTKDMLYTLTIPYATGIPTTTVPFNLGQAENIGSEITLGWREKRRDLTYGIGANFSFNKNKVIKVGVPGAILTDGSVGEAWGGSSRLSRTVDGQPMGQFWGYKVIGIFESQAQVDEYNARAAAAGAPNGYYWQRNTGPGDLIFDDMGQGWVSANSQTYIGNPWPKMTYGINMDFSYKGFDLTFLFQGVAGQEIYNGLKAYTQNIYGDANTTADIFKNSFFGDNGLTDMPRSGFYNSSGTYVIDPNRNYSTLSSFWVEKGDYLKLKNAVLGYTFPKILTQKLLIEKARIYVSAHNLFTFTKYTGIDPEIAGGVRQRGIDTFTRYLPSRLISFGVDLTF